MDGLDREVLKRLPLAEAVSLLLWQVADEPLLDELFDGHRATGSEQKVRFSLLSHLVVEALTQHQGSGLASFEAAQQANRLPATPEAFYGKLRRLPLALSQALVSRTADRLRQALPATPLTKLPVDLAGYQVLVIDGKKIKNLPKRLKPLRGVKGKALGGKVVAALLLNQGIVTTIEASPDGEANDAPLTPGLLEQCQHQLSGPLLYVADRQFCDLKIPPRIAELGQFFVIRYSKKMIFSVEKEEIFHDDQGRVVRDARGRLGSERDSRAMHLRRVTLERPGEEEVSLVTNLPDEEAISATAILDVYQERWGIERVFQQVTEVFQIQQLISSSPQGAIFQFALCTLLYNVIQVVRAHLAAAHQRSAASLSSEKIFRSVCDQLSAMTLLCPQGLPHELKLTTDTKQLKNRLAKLLGSTWSNSWNKSPPKKKNRPPDRSPIKGNHCSAWKIIQNAKQRN